MSAIITAQFRNTTIRLIRDVTAGLKRDLHNPSWIGGFCLPMIASLGHECGGFRLMEEGKPTVAGSLGGISFAQWTGVRATPPVGRRKQFMDFCRARHLHPYGYDAAVAFIIHELTTTAKGVVQATLSAKPYEPTAAGFSLAEARKVDANLLGRVVKFEKLYENAGVKHYPSRYAYALAARDVYTEWAQAGFPEPGKYVMPAARFSKQFDDEFGRGETATTTRWDSLSSAQILPDGRAYAKDAAGVSVIVPADDPALALTKPAELAQPVARRGSWPEDRLSKSEIEAIQKRLRQLGFVRVGEADGRWGPSTVGAISALQMEAGIAPDGHYGPATRKALTDGVEHKVSEARKNATAPELLKAGEPTLQAVHPVSITSKIMTWGASAGAVVTGITSAWPQASTTIDQIKGYFADFPGWVWFVGVAIVAAYLWFSTKQVKQSVVAGYREGAVTTLAKPLRADDSERVGFMPAVPDEPDPGSVTVLSGLGVHDGVYQRVYQRDHDSPTSEPDRPLGVE